MQPLATLLVFLTFSLSLQETLLDDLSVLKLMLEELKQEQKEASDAFHAELSKKIEANIQEIGESIKEATTKFNETKDPAVLEKARNDFKNKLTGFINEIKDIKKEGDQLKTEIWEANKEKIQTAIDGVEAIVDAAHQEIIDCVKASPKDLKASLARMNGTSSWQTVAWLLMFLSIILVSTIAILLIKLIGQGHGYQRLN